MYEEIKNAYGLRPVWDAIREIYLEFARICEKYRLRHYASGGTALGAIRHNGFIPWDDDIDVVMPRDDYEKFLLVAEKELPCHLKIVNHHNTPEFVMLYSKVQETRTEIISMVEDKIGHTLSDGLFIDFYPMDGYPAGWRKMLTKFGVLLLDSVWRYRCETFCMLSTLGKVAWMIGAVGATVLKNCRSGSDIVYRYEKLLKRCRYDDSTFVTDIAYLRNPFGMNKMRKCLFGEPQKMQFEDFMMMTPQDVVGYCLDKFGDNYVQLPPEEDRVTTHKRAEKCVWWHGPTTSKHPYGVDIRTQSVTPIES